MSAERSFRRAQALECDWHGLGENPFLVGTAAQTPCISAVLKAAFAHATRPQDSTQRYAPQAEHYR